MAKRFPPRFLPTLTEVVTPQVRNALARAAAPDAQAAPVAQDSYPMDTIQPLPDRDTLARQVIELVTPQLEAELLVLGLLQTIIQPQAQHP